MLMGLVTKNAILLVDYAKVLQRRDGKSAAGGGDPGRPHPAPADHHDHPGDDLRHDAALSSPSAAGAEMRAPMARAVVGGLITSTFLTLLVVPVMYTLMDDLGIWLKRRWKGNHV